MLEEKSKNNRNDTDFMFVSAHYKGRILKFDVFRGRLCSTYRFFYKQFLKNGSVSLTRARGNSNNQPGMVFLKVFRLNRSQLYSSSFLFLSDLMIFFERTSYGRVEIAFKPWKIKTGIHSKSIQLRNPVTHVLNRIAFGEYIMSVVNH